jgi:hypothetical protein
MLPTNKLRYQRRKLLLTDELEQPGKSVWLGHYQEVLQQWWEEERDFNVHWVNPPSGEWRDVPVETE